MLAESGLCVVASIHQPRLSAYESFSKLLLLSKGELVYGGRCGVLGEAVSYFAGHGYVCPPRINPADFFIEICFGFVKSETVEYDELSELWRTEYHRQVAARDAHKPMQHEGVSREDWRTFLEEEMYFCTLDLDEVVPESYARAMELPRESGLNGPSWAQLHAQVRSWQMPAPDQPGLHWQFILCLQRFLIKRLRMRVMIMSSHLVVVVLSLVCGFVNGPQVKSSSLTFLVIFICLFSTYSLFTLPRPPPLLTLPCPPPLLILPWPPPLLTLPWPPHLLTLRRPPRLPNLPWHLTSSPLPWPPPALTLPWHLTFPWHIPLLTSPSTAPPNLSRTSLSPQVHGLSRDRDDRTGCEQHAVHARGLRRRLAVRRADGALHRRHNHLVSAPRHVRPSPCEARLTQPLPQPPSTARLPQRAFHSAPSTAPSGPLFHS